MGRGRLWLGRMGRGASFLVEQYDTRAILGHDDYQGSHMCASGPPSDVQDTHSFSMQFTKVMTMMIHVCKCAG